VNDKNAQDEGFGLPPEGAPLYTASMEARVAVLEEIARNTEKLLGKMDARMDRMEAHNIQMEERLIARMEAMEHRLTARIEAGEVQTDKRIEAVDRRIESVEKRMEAMETRIDKRMESFERHLIRLEDRHVTDFRWMLGLGIAAVAFLFAVMAHGFHWF